MSKSSNRIVNLLTQATQALEKGQLQVRMPEMETAIANSMDGNGKQGGVTMLPEGKRSFRASLSNGLAGSEAEISEQEMSEVCQAFNQMTEAICKRDRERLHFMAMAAHDLNNPLMVISGAARMLRYDDVPLDERRQCLDRLMRNVVALQYIVSELTDKVQAQTGEFRLRFEEIDLTALVREVVTDFSSSVTSHPIRFEADGACPIIGDRQRLQRMLLNLLSNAVKYSDAGREVTVSVWQRNDQVFLSVQDRG